LSCDKDGLEDHGLPKPTQEGKGIFAFLMNGEVWEPCVKPCFLCPPEHAILAYNAEYRALRLETQNSCNGAFRVLKISIDSIDVNNNIIGGYSARYYDLATQCDKYEIDTTANNFVKITRYDATPTGVASGLFEFTFINKCGDLDTLKITNGRFDVRTSF